MNNRNNHCYSAATAGLAGFVFISIAAPSFQVQASSYDLDFDRDMLKQVQTLYRLDEGQAIERLAREEMAAETYQAIKRLGLKSYAGAWFDDETWSLHVAISDAGDSEWVERLGADVVPVAYSLDELEAAREHAYAHLANGRVGDHPIRESYVDFKSNRVVIGVAPTEVGRSETLLDSFGLDPEMFQVIASLGELLPSSGNIRGADGMRNITIPQQCAQVNVYPCSIGAAVEGGFVTAAHCGAVGHQMRTPSGQLLGQVAGSTWQIFSNCGSAWFGKDSGWVQTVSGWTPTPQVNGYTEGVFSLPARWAGMLEAPVGGTVCRYGQTSGGPHCGQIEQKNANESNSNLFGITRASGTICTWDGDSGGPYLTPARQIQGTNTGGSFIGTENTCHDDPPVPPEYVIFQPIRTTLEEFGQGSDWLRMLTTHGAAKPTIHDTSCWGTGWGTYSCWLGYFDSQGKTEFIWYSNSAGIGNTHEGLNFSEYCYPPGDQVGVSLHVSNPYGTTSWYTTFACPFN